MLQSMELQRVGLKATEQERTNDSAGSYECGGGGGERGSSLYFPLNFALNPKLF